MATLSQYEQACVAEPSSTRFSVARICFAIRSKTNDGVSFTSARDTVLANPVYDGELEQARLGGWDLRQTALPLSGIATTTGL